MKKVFSYIFTIAVLMFVETSCTDDVLDQKPVDSFDQESVFSDIGLAKAFLGFCYDRMYGHSSNQSFCREDLLSSGTDQTLCIHRPTNYGNLKNTLSPDMLGYFNHTGYNGSMNWAAIYSNIQKTNLLLAYIDKVPAPLATDKTLITQMKGEAYYIRATMYGNLWMSYGGLVLHDKPWGLGDDYLTITRSTLQETLDFILADIDQALVLLPATMEQGRANRAAAAALKSRLLFFAAGNLVNGGLASTASNPLVAFQSGTQASRWQAARDAAKAIMDGTYGTFSLTGTTSDPPSPLTEANVKTYSDNYFNIFNQKGAWNKEVIWAAQYVLSGSGGNTNRANIWFGPNGYHNWGNNNPTEPAVRKFEMANGTPFVWDNGNGQYLRKATAAELAADPLKSPYNGREPRFYATVMYHGAPWQARPTDAAGFDPYNKVQTGHFYNLDGTKKANGLDTRQSIIEGWNGTKNGYYLKKFMDPATAGQYFYNTNHWLEFRYAEILLNYAEACIEMGGANLQPGLDALNMVRNRAGLPDRVAAVQATARTYLRHERYIELFAEGQHWYDIRRWVIFSSVVENVCEMKIKEFVNGNMEWFYDIAAKADTRTWGGDKYYWIPLSRDEMNKAPQLQQNPSY
ncbi:MAG: RagB/SusD family nutrient uptake outer membrane protein [Bacteroidales bacterium]|nr:RagB/SusD family nutrient uptake outer membrane protein [Bacteroidales bacterium]